MGQTVVWAGPTPLPLRETLPGEGAGDSEPREDIASNEDSSVPQGLSSGGAIRNLLVLRAGAKDQQLEGAGRQTSRLSS